MELNKDLELFSIQSPEYNIETYIGRVRHFLKVINPMTLLETNAKVREMQKMIKEQEEYEKDIFEKTGERKTLTQLEKIKQLRYAQTVVGSAVHPDTKQFIPRVMRVSSFLPCNIPIVFGFIMAAPTPFNTIFWQWIN